MWVVNPLRIHGDTFDQLFHFRNSDVYFGVGTMPGMAVTSPVQLAGAYAMALAEAWGAYALVREVTGRQDIAVNCRVFPSDMRNLGLVYGSPEMLLADLVCRQLCDRYGWTLPTCDAFHSMSPRPDLQSAGQRGAYGMAMAMAGKRSFSFGGLLSTDWVFSPIQLMADIEMLSYFRQVSRGFDFSEEALSRQVIADVGPGGSFLLHESTLRDHRDVFLRPQFWTHDSFGTWQANGESAIEERMAKEIDALIARHDYRLPDGIARDLDQICLEAEADLLGGRPQTG